MHIQEALVLMIEAFKNGKAEEKKLLLTLLFKFVENVSKYLYLWTGLSHQPI